MSDVPYGYCQCRCGKKTRIAAKTNTAQQQRKGQPNRFLAGHRPAKRPDYLEEAHGHSTPCWIWQGGKDRDGYGLVHRPEHNGGAHIWYYKQANGPIPEGLELDHLCRVPSCVNPEHLEAIPHEENVRRGLQPKLSADAVREIRTTPKTYGSTAALARKFGVHPNTIWRVQSGRGWRL